jgi:hypothetical protein
MPVTAKLSRKLYETFGDEDTNELVDLLNSVHTYRGELRELNEANFVRFDGKLAELNGRWEGRIAAFDAKLEQRLAELRRDLSIEIANAQQATLKWMFTFWVPTAVGIIGTAIAVVALLLRG